MNWNLILVILILAVVIYYLGKYYITGMIAQSSLEKMNDPDIQQKIYMQHIEGHIKAMHQEQCPHCKKPRREIIIQYFRDQRPDNHLHVQGEE